MIRFDFIAEEHADNLFEVLEALRHLLKPLNNHLVPPPLFHLHFYGYFPVKKESTEVAVHVTGCVLVPATWALNELEDVFLLLFFESMEF